MYFKLLNHQIQQQTKTTLKIKPYNNNHRNLFRRNKIHSSHNLQKNMIKKRKKNKIKNKI